MKSCLIVYFILNAVAAQTPVTTTRGEIKWSANRVLTYKDFKESVPPASSWAALTSSAIYFSFGTLDDSTLSSFVIYASFDPSKSWMKRQTPAVLAHEQLHFDITEVYARKLYSELRILNGKITQARMQELFSSVNQEWGEVQDQYDDETAHGTKPDIQKQWNDKVSQWLSEYEKYPASQ